MDGRGKELVGQRQAPIIDGPLAVSLSKKTSLSLFYPCLALTPLSTPFTNDPLNSSLPTQRSSTSAPRS